jgi:L-aspartate oxidase
MPNFHPLADLAPRDIVSRAIMNQMQRTGDTNVYLDLTHLDAKKINKRFPALRQLCLAFDLDISKDYIPVRPSAHYMIGGVSADAHGRTNISNLYCAGEAASSGLHGANRLGSNSLLEGLVFGYRAACDIAGRAKAGPRRGRSQSGSQLRHPSAPNINYRDVENALRSLLWRQAGIERNAQELSQAINRIDFWCSYIMDKEFNLKEGWLLQDALTAALIICHSALERQETRGTHIRSDFPDKDDTNWKRHSVVRRK